MKLYRYVDGCDDEPFLFDFEVMGTTKCGHWIMDIRSFPERKRWVSSKTVGHYAYTTIELALNNYVIRKENQIIILERNLENTKMRLKIAKNIDLSVKMLPSPIGF